MKRIVLDTNVLVSSAYDDFSASARILEACSAGKLAAIVSPALRDEYRKILPQTVNVPGHAEVIGKFLEASTLIVPQSTPKVVLEDPEDDKLIALAVDGQADAIITNDRHLLDLDPYRGIRIVRPVAFHHLRSEEGGEAWKNLARMIGIG